jgi:hypothetical protein
VRRSFRNGSETWRRLPENSTSLFYSSSRCLLSAGSILGRRPTIVLVLLPYWPPRAARHSGRPLIKRTPLRCGESSLLDMLMMPSGRNPGRHRLRALAAGPAPVPAFRLRQSGLSLAVSNHPNLLRRGLHWQIGWGRRTRPTCTPACFLIVVSGQRPHSLRASLVRHASRNAFH